MPYLIAKILFFLGAAGLLGFLIAWWWTRHAERRRSMELEGVWTQKVQRANRELDALRADLRTEATRTQSVSDEEQILRTKVMAAESERNSLQEKIADLSARLEKSERIKPADPALAQKVAALEAQLAAKSTAAETAEAGLTQVRADLAERAAALAKLQANLAGLEILPVQLQEADAKRKAAEESLQIGKAAQAAAEAESAKLKTRLAELDSARAASATDRDAKLKEWESRYQSLLKEKDGAQARLLAQIGELEPLKGKVAELEKQLALKSAAGDVAAKSLEARYQGMLKEKDVSLARLLAQVAELEPLKGKVSELHNQMAKNAQESAANAEAAAKAIEARYQDQLNEKNDSVAKLSARVADLETQIANRVVAPPIAIGESTLEELRQSLAAKEARILELEASLAAAATATRKAAKPSKADDPNAPDDLKKIRGIGPVLHGRLTGIGVTSFEQIAKWTPEDVEEYQRKLPEFKDRIRRDNWIESAKEEFEKKYGRAI